MASCHWYGFVTFKKVGKINMKKYYLIAVLVLTIAIFKSSIVFAYSINTLYMLEADGTLYTLDESNGNATPEWSINGPEYGQLGGFASVVDIVFDGTALYGITSKKLLTINSFTGYTSIIGDMGFDDLINGMAVDSDGTFYCTSIDGDFGIVDPLTGKGTLISNLGNGLTFEGGLAFAADGTLYASVNVPGYVYDRLAIINPITGEGILVSDFDLGYTTINSLSIKDGVLYGAEDNGMLLQIDTETGQSIVVGQNGLRQWGLATSPVPVPSAVWMLGSGLIGLMGIKSRRNR